MLGRTITLLSSLLPVALAVMPARAEVIDFDKYYIGAAPMDFDFWRTGEGAPGAHSLEERGSPVHANKHVRSWGWTAIGP